VILVTVSLLSFEGAVVAVSWLSFCYSALLGVCAFFFFFFEEEFVCFFFNYFLVWIFIICCFFNIY